MEVSMIQEEISSFAEIKNPTEEDYRRLLTFATHLQRLFRRERISRSAINKKRNKLAAKNMELKERLERLGGVQ